MNKPSPALVAQRAVQRMPRWALLLFCAAYLLPGLFGRDPWKNADVSAVGYMARLASGQTAWLQPELAGLPATGGLIPYWLGAGSIKLLTPWVSMPMAARWPFAALLAATLVLTWYACFHLARREEAQPLAFAFGGEAQPIDYARAIADGAVLALISQLGLLQLGHETTPELVQLFAVALLLYGLAASRWRSGRARIALVLAPSLLASSGAPMTALLLGCGSSLLLLWLARQRPLNTDPFVDRLPGSVLEHSTAAALWVLVGTALAAAIGAGLDSWHWRLGTWQAAIGFGHLAAWFTWPVWPMAAWTLWQWRHHILRGHIALPLLIGLVCVVVSISMGTNDRALMLALPGLAVLAAFALPTLKRSISAAMDWFSVLFFSGWAITFWVVYVSMQTGVPQQPAQNVARLVPGFIPVFQLPALIAALIATVAWAGLVFWRTGRHRHPLWKSLVLPAGGVALNWLLAMTLLLPALDYARSYRPLMASLAKHLPASSCVVSYDLTRAEIAAVEVLGGWHAEPDTPDSSCRWMLMSRKLHQTVVAPAGWQTLARERRPADREDTLVVLKRR